MRSFVEDFFDVNSQDHMDAYKYLQKFGFWPAGFKPDDVEMDPNWQILLEAKMGEAWRNHMLSEKLGDKKQKNKNYKIDYNIEDKLKIVRASNGYVVKSYTYLDTELKNDEPLQYRENLYCCNDTIDYNGDGDFSQHDLTGDEIAMFNLLHYIKESYCVYYNKHKKFNLVIKFEENEELKENKEDESNKLTIEQKHHLSALADRLSDIAHEELEYCNRVYDQCGTDDQHVNITSKHSELMDYIKKL